MSKVFVLDIAKCSGCYNCQLACKDEHCGNDWMPYSRPQPPTGHFWMKVNEHVEGTIPKVKIHYIPQLCRHCDNPVCVTACSNNAITKREDGIVLIDPENCIGCEACLNACPYDAIFKNAELGICQKCTGCAHLLDNGDKLPRCVEACPTDALRFGDREEFEKELKDAVTFEKDGTGPNVYYLNIPGYFIAGTIYDPIDQEVIIGGTITAKCCGKEYSAISDDFGDFWIKNVGAGVYDISIKAEGFKEITMRAINVSASINLGDIPMEK